MLIQAVGLAPFSFTTKKVERKIQCAVLDQLLLAEVTPGPGPGRLDRSIEAPVLFIKFATVGT